MPSSSVLLSVAQEVFNLVKIVVDLAKDPSVPEATRKKIEAEGRDIAKYIDSAEAKEQARLKAIRPK